MAKITQNPTINTTADQGAVFYLDDGTVIAASLGNPEGLVDGDKGSILTAEDGSGIYYKTTDAGTLTGWVLVGTGGGTLPITTGLLGWYKADSLTLADGAAVSSWADSSSNGYTLTQATGARQPQFIALSNDNQYPAVRFSGTGGTADLLANAAMAIDRRSVSIFIVMTPTEVMSTQVFLAFGNANTFLVQQNSGAPALFDGVGTRVSNPNTWLDKTTQCVRLESDASGLRFYRGVYSTSLAAITAANITGLNIGSDPAFSFPWHGDIQEVIIYNRILTAAEVAAVERAYLNPKYDLLKRTRRDLRDLALYVGDSLTVGIGATSNEFAVASQAVKRLSRDVAYEVVASSSAQISTINLASFQSDILSKYNAQRRRQALINAIGSNSIDYSGYVSQCQALQALGWPVVARTLTPRGATGADAPRISFNSNVRANWPTFAVALSDIASDGRIGDDGDQNDTTYYVDTIHMTNAGYAVSAIYDARALTIALRMPGIIYETSTDLTTSGTGEDTLSTFDLTKVLTQDGDVIRVRAAFSATAGTGATKQYRAKLNATNIEDSGAIQAGVSGDFVMNLEIMRISSTVARISKNSAASVATNLPRYQEVTGLDWNAISFSTTGEVAIAADAVITQRLLQIEFKPAN